MANLPVFKDPNQNFMLMQNSWKSAITPVLQNEINQGQMIEATLAIGNNTINHLLSRKQIGWMITDINAVSSIYRSQPLNDKTLTLHSSAACSVAIWVF